MRYAGRRPRFLKLEKPLPENRGRRPLPRLPLIHDRFAGGAHVRRELREREAQLLTHVPNLVGIVGRDLLSAQRSGSIFRPDGLLEV